MHEHFVPWQFRGRQLQLEFQVQQWLEASAADNKSWQTKSPRVNGMQMNHVISAVPSQDRTLINSQDGIELAPFFFVLLSILTSMQHLEQWIEPVRLTIHTENVKMYLCSSSVASEQPQQAPAPVFWREIKNKCCRNNSNLQLGKDTLLIYLCLCRLVCKKKNKVFLQQKLTLCFLVTYDRNLLSSVCVCIPMCAAQTLYTLLPVHTHTHTHTPHHPAVTHFVLTHSRRVKLQNSEWGSSGTSPVYSVFSPLPPAVASLLWSR